MRHDLQDWSGRLSAVLRERRISNNAAAQMIGVSPATFASWINGVTRPNVESLPAIAELTGLSVWYLHELAGYLPESYSPATAVIQAAEKQRDLYLEMQKWATEALDTTGLSPAAQAAGLIMKINPSWQVTLRPNLKGFEYSIASNTLLGLERARGRTGPLSQERNELEQTLGNRLATLGVMWRRRSVPGWDAAPGILLEVPEHERTRVLGPAPTPGLPPVFCVLGVPYAHAELVGALVAEAVDYAYTNTRTEACVRDELGMGPTRTQLARAARELHKENFSRSAPPRSSIWTLTFPEALDKSLLDLLLGASSDVHMIYIRAEPKLVRFGAKVWDYDPDECTEMVSKLDYLSQELGHARCTVITISDSNIFALDPQDGVTDAAVHAAKTVLERFAVGRSRWKGYLGDVFQV